MPWSDKWIVDARAALIALRGAGPLGNDGQALPALSALDSISVVGQVTPAMVTMLGRWANSQGFSQKGQAVSSQYLSDGALDATNLTATLSDPAAFLTATAYYAGYPSPSTPYIRATTEGGWAFGPAATFEPFRGSDEDGLLSFVRQCIIDWQRLCDASASAIVTGGADITDMMSQDDLQALWSALGAVCSSLDVLAENPPAILGDRLAGALRESLNATEKFVGQTVAQVSQEIGAAAGNLAEGFLANVGLAGVAVAGIALYLFVR